MPWSTITIFTDPYAYQETVRSAQAEVLVTARGDFHAELTRIELYKLSIECGRETLPRVSSGAVSTERLAIHFLIGADQQPGLHCGIECRPGEIFISNAGSTYHNVRSAFSHWGAVSVSPDELRALAGRNLTPSPSSKTLRPRPALMSRMMNLREAAVSLARTAPDLLAQPEVARALEHALLHAIIACVSDEEADRHYVANRYQQSVLARFEQLLAEKADTPLHLAEICAAIGTPERTLRACCQRQLGMGPIRFLRLRRMHLVRQALLKADPATTTVTSIATGQGFWELGKFSVAYRSLFGESPAATLRRNPDGGTGPPGSPFAPARLN
jgi:AraC-like DNA-binding protein